MCGRQPWFPFYTLHSTSVDKGCACFTMMMLIASPPPKKKWAIDHYCPLPPAGLYAPGHSAHKLYELFKYWFISWNFTSNLIGRSTWRDRERERGIEGEREGQREGEWDSSSGKLGYTSIWSKFMLGPTEEAQWHRERKGAGPGDWHWHMLKQHYIGHMYMYVYTCMRTT